MTLLRHRRGGWEISQRRTWEYHLDNCGQEESGGDQYYEPLAARCAQSTLPFKSRKNSAEAMVGAIRLLSRRPRCVQDFAPVKVNCDRVAVK